MSGYTVTITPDNDQSGPQTTIHVDTTTGAAKVIELTVRAVDGAGLSPQVMPAIDYAALIAALAPPSAAAPAAITAVETPAPRSRRGESIEAAPRAARSGRGSRGRPAKATKSAPTRSRRRQAAEAAEPARTGRAYRRMPEQDQVVAAWQETNSVRAVAEH